MLGLGLGVDRGGFVPSIPLLLDTYTGAAAAYSLRKLRTDYTGAAIRVRESATNTEADIGFTSSGALNTSALAAHCGANNGFVVKIYSQTGVGDYVQASAANQAKIYDGSTGVILKNGKPAIDFEVANRYTATVTNIQNATNLTTFNVISPDLAAAANTTTLTIFGYASGGANNTNRGISYAYATGSLSGEYFTLLFSSVTKNGARLGSTTYRHTAGEQLLLSTLNLSSGTSVFKNNSAITFDLSNSMTTGTDSSPSAAAAASDLMYLNSVNGTNNGVAQLWQESIYYPTNESTNRTAIESNINAHYNIY